MILKHRHFAFLLRHHLTLLLFVNNNIKNPFKFEAIIWQAAGRLPHALNATHIVIYVINNLHQNVRVRVVEKRTTGGELGFYCTNR